MLYYVIWTCVWRAGSLPRPPTKNGAPVVKSPIAEVWTQSKGDLQQERDGSDSGVFNGQGKMVDTLQ